MIINFFKIYIHQFIIPFPFPLFKKYISMYQTENSREVLGWSFLESRGTDRAGLLCHTDQHDHSTDICEQEHQTIPKPTQLTMNIFKDLWIYPLCGSNKEVKYVNQHKIQFLFYHIDVHEGCWLILKYWIKCYQYPNHIVLRK